MAALLRSSKPVTQQGISTKFHPLSGETPKVGNVSPRNNGVGVPDSSTPRRLTQEAQNKVDEEKQQEVMQNLLQTWMERLQLISVITTFFASTESTILGQILPAPNEVLSTAGQIANVCFMCALVLHAFASVISFLGAFFLIRYKLTVAEKNEDQVEKELVASPTNILSDEEKSSSPTSPYANGMRTDSSRGRAGIKSESPENQTIWSTNPRLVQVGPFNGGPPSELLSRCHSLCVFLTFLGFLLVILGLVSFAWYKLPQSIGISASIVMAFCTIAGALILIVPSTEKSHIFCDRKSL